MPAAPAVEWGFALLSVAVAAVVAWHVRSARIAMAIAIWAALSWALAAAGALRDVSAMPPRPFFVIVPGFILTVALGVSNAGRALAVLPVTWLVGGQAFRILVELLIHRAYEVGVAPVQLTWDGMNFDIVTGVTALLLAPFASRLPRAVLAAWNAMGLGLLAWVVSVAVLSLPTPFQQFWPDNVWVGHAPYIWLPTVLVPAALLGHIALFRHLGQRQASPSRS